MEEREEQQEKNQTERQEADDLQREGDVWNHCGEPQQMNHTGVVEEKSVHREKGFEEQEEYGHHESERTERQERQEETYHQSWEWRE